MRIWNGKEWEEQTEEQTQLTNARNKLGTKLETKADIDLINKKSNAHVEENMKQSDTFQSRLEKAGSTLGDLATNVGKGLFRGTEALVDLGRYGVAGVADALGAKDYANDVRERAKQDTTSIIFKPADDYFNKNSLLKENGIAENVAQGVGQVGAIIGSGALLPGKLATVKLGKFELPTTSILSGAGSGMTEAYNNGASNEQALAYGAMSGLVEGFSESLFGGLGKTFSSKFGGGALDDVLVKKLTDKISSKTLKTLTDVGIKAAGEGAEEVLSGLGSAMAKKLTYMNKEELTKLINDENLLNSFVVGALTSAVAQSPSTYHALKGNIRTSNQINEIKLPTKNQQTNLNNNLQLEQNVEEKSNSGLNNNFQNNSQNTINLPTINDTNASNRNALGNLQEFLQQQEEAKKQQIASEQNENINNRIDSLEKQLEKQETRILEESESQKQAMIEHFKEYLEENNITNPTQQDINDSITDNLIYDNELGMADTMKAEQLYNQYVKEYMQEKGIPFNDTKTLKNQQLDIIQKINPMKDDYHTGIRNADDIKTFEEAINDDESFTWGDYTKEDAIRDLQKGTATIYSSYPIENGNFVSTSKNQARDYAGGDSAKIYSKEVPLTDVAWINGDEGQYAKVPTIPTAKDFKQNIKLPTQNVEKRNAVSDNLESYSQEEANSILRKENNVIVENKQELANYVREALNNPNSNKNLHLGIIPNETIQRIKDEVQNIKSEKIDTLFKDNINYALAVKQEEIRHMKKESLTQQDIVDFIDSVDELIAQFDTVSYTLYGNQNALRFKKVMNDGTHIALEVISNKNHTLRTHTLFLDQVDFENKKRTLSPTLDELNNSPSKTSEMDGLSVLSNNDNTTNSTKSQMVLPTYNMQQNKESIPSIPTRDDIMKNLPKDPTKESSYAEEAYNRKKQHEKLIKQDVKNKVKKESENAINIASKVGQKYLELDRNQKSQLKEQLSKYIGKTQKQLTNAKTWNEIKDIVNNYAEKQLTYVDRELQDVKNVVKNTNIKVDDNLKAQITDYNDFRKENFGKLKLTNDGMSVDSIYQELSEQYPYYFGEATTQADMLYELSDFMNKDTNMVEKIKLDDNALEKATTKIYNSLLRNTLNEDAIDDIKQELQKKFNKRTREIVQRELQDEMGITTDDLQIGKDISSIEYQRTDPIRLNEKVFGTKIGKKINDATINKTKHNEAERIRFLNQERDEIKNLGIKPRSKESAAVQKYGEKQYINDKGDVLNYGDKELMAEFSDEKTREKIKKAAETLRNKYDKYIDNINEVITEMGYDPIPKRKDYMRHFQELNDKFTEWGLPINRQSLNENNIPTDINGLTDQFKPGKNWFASAMQRKGLKTTYDAITGIDGYLEGASNLMYHTEDIQRYRALSKLVRDTFGQTHGLDNVDLSTEEGQKRLNDIYDNKLSKYAAWLDEQANALAGKKGAIDRGAERVLGRRIYSVLDAAKKQVGSNMTGFNVRSALTNFASAVQGASKTNKLAFIKGTLSTVKNIVHNDGLINKSDFLTSRFGSDQLSKKLWQKASNAGQILMSGSDYFTANQIWRSKYYENLSKGMSESQAIKNADDFAARIMGDRSKGATAEIFNSKTLGLLTQFQLEVNNQWSSMIHDNKMDIKNGNKTGATVLFQLGQLAAMSYLFNNFMKSMTGSDVMIDPIDMLKKIFGSDDDDKSLEERAQEVLGDVVNDLPFASFLTGGRIPVAEAFTGASTAFKKLTGQKDKYGNDITWSDVKDDAISSAFYWLLPSGYGQAKKTTQGLSMYDGRLPMPGSYTNSGNLRFRADESTSGKVKAALFGQYSSKEAQEYRESGYKAISKARLDEVKDLNMTASEYRKYREKLNEAGTKNADKIDFIANSNYTDKQKNIMAKNVLERDFDIKEYEKYDSYEEYNYAYKNPEKYSVIKQITSYDKYNTYVDKLTDIRNNTSNDKEETIKYINTLPLSIPQKAMFIKQYYKSYKKYDKEIVEYVKKNCKTKEEREQVLSQLGFTVKDGRVYY